MIQRVSNSLSFNPIHLLQPKPVYIHGSINDWFLSKRERWQAVDMMSMEGTPAAHGYYMPAEWEPHSQIWTGWPESGKVDDPKELNFLTHAEGAAKFISDEDKEASLCSFHLFCAQPNSEAIFLFVLKFFNQTKYLFGNGYEYRRHAMCPWLLHASRVGTPFTNLDRMA